MDMNRERARQLLEVGIPLTHFEIAQNAAAEFDLQEGEDPVQSFKEWILFLNERQVLPEILSGYCERYQVEYNPPEIKGFTDEFEQ